MQNKYRRSIRAIILLKFSYNVEPENAQRRHKKVVWPTCCMIEVCLPIGFANRLHPMKYLLIHTLANGDWDDKLGPSR